MPKTISDIQTDAVYLAALIDGADLLADRATCGDDNDPEFQQARNSLPAIFADMRRRANELANALEVMGKKGGEA